MKENFKKIFIFFLALFGGCCIVAVSLTLAQGDNAQGAALRQNLCSRISALATKVDQRIANRQSNLDGKRNQISLRLQKIQDQRASQLAAKREKWDNARAVHYEKLESRARTDAQKQALTQFKQEVDAAIAARRTAVDLALANFEQGISEALISRRSSSDAVLNEFRNSIRAAFGQTESNCASDKQFSEIRESLRSGLQAAKDGLSSDVQSIDKLGAQVSELVKARNEAIQQAVQDFKAKMETARDNFKAAVQE